MDQALELLGAYLDGHKKGGDQWMVYDAYLWGCRHHEGEAWALAFMPQEDWDALERRYELWRNADA